MQVCWCIIIILISYPNVTVTWLSWSHSPDHWSPTPENNHTVQYLKDSGSHSRCEYCSMCLYLIYQAVDWLLQLCGYDFCALPGFCVLVLLWLFGLQIVNFACFWIMTFPIDLDVCLCIFYKPLTCCDTKSTLFFSFFFLTQKPHIKNEFFAYELRSVFLEHKVMCSPVADLVPLQPKTQSSLSVRNCIYIILRV